MSKHTPGPWKVLEHSWSDTSIVAEGFDHGICLLDINHATEESQEADEALMAANAHLIAASPDLLAALKALVQQVERGDFDHIGADHPDSAVGAARAAIAKAEVTA
jgi:hypothetical protein